MASELPYLLIDWDAYRDTVSNDVGLRIPTQMVEGLENEQSLELLQETLGYDQAVSQLDQGIAVDAAALRAVLLELLELELLENPLRRLHLGAAGHKRVERRYSWATVMEQWRVLLFEQRAQRAHAEDAPGAPPSWLPSCSERFKSLAIQVISLQPTPNQIRSHYSTSVNRWDLPLIQELKGWLEQPETMAPSLHAKGWPLKQNLPQISI